MMDQLDKLHGDTYNVTYHIGEDLCKGGNVLISEKVKKRLQKAKNFESCTYNLFENEEEDENMLAHKIFEIKGVSNLKFEILPTSNGEFLKPELMPIVSRHNTALTKDQLIELDAELNKKYDRSFTALMWEFELGEIEKKYGAL